jgi:hypothetical protein
MLDATHDQVASRRFICAPGNGAQSFSPVNPGHARAGKYASLAPVTKWPPNPAIVKSFVCRFGMGETPAQAYLSATGEMVQRPATR